MFKNIIITPQKKDEKNLSQFLKANWHIVKKKFAKKGVLLFRGFHVNNLDDFNLSVRSIHKKILNNYDEGSTPRSKIKGKIFTSTEISKNREIPIHNEMSYSTKYPNNLWFYSQKVASKGGQTTIANSRKIYKDLNKKIKNIFEKKKIMYVRRYGFGMDVPWQIAFNTKNKNKVNSFCKKNAIKFKWINKNKLITWRINGATTKNPDFNFKIWFNQAHLFHNSNVDKKSRKMIENFFGKHFFSRDAKFGDGSDIPLIFLQKIRKTLENNSYNVSRKERDVLLINNLLVSHGRRKFSGKRKLYVTMTDDRLN